MNLEQHGRYPFSGIDGRPVYDWPGGRRLAVYIALNVEVFAFGRGRGSDFLPPSQALGVALYGWRDYGNRVGFWRLMDLFDRLGLPCAVNLNAAAYELCPGIAERARARGDEIVGHGLSNSDAQEDLDEASERAMIAEATRAIARHEGKAPAGWMSPWVSESKTTPDLLKEAGYRYLLDWPIDDQPVWMQTRAGPLLSIPYPLEVNDIPAITTHRRSADEFGAMIGAQFDVLLEESARRPLVMGISLHTGIAGQPFRIPALAAALERIAAHGDRVWLTTPGAICAHVEGLPEGTVPGQ